MTTTKEMTIERFDLNQRVQHILLILSFTMLALTGLPQSFAQARWAQIWMAIFGGISGVRKVHHLFAVLMAFLFLYHVILTLGDLCRKRFSRSMLPGVKDFRDGMHAVRYLLGKETDPPQFDRFDFRQKLEYWALIWGTILMGVSGLVLMFPVAVSQILPGEVIYASKAAHGLEALLAVASIVTWHMYNAHLARGIFPIDTTIFTGKISVDRMQEEHLLEYQRMAASPIEVEKQATEKTMKKGKSSKKAISHKPPDSDR